MHNYAAIFSQKENKGNIKPTLVTIGSKIEEVVSEELVVVWFTLRLAFAIITGKLKEKIPISIELQSDGKKRYFVFKETFSDVNIHIKIGLASYVIIDLDTEKPYPLEGRILTDLYPITNAIDLSTVKRRNYFSSEILVSPIKKR